MVAPKLANPAPLGLMGFGMTTVLLNIHNAGFFPDIGPMIMAMGLFYGGAAQVIAGILEYKKNNTFGMTAFVSYGFFWMTLVGLLLLPKIFPSIDPTPTNFFGCYLAIWGIFTGFMFVGSLKGPKMLQIVFSSLTLLFLLLALTKWLGNPVLFTIGAGEKTITLGMLAGLEGIFCGGSAIYLAMAEVINEKFERTVLPIGA